VIPNAGVAPTMRPITCRTSIAGASLVRANDRKTIRRGIAIDCQVVRGSSWGLVARRSLDLSPRGILCVAGDDVAIGEDLVVAFRISSFDVPVQVRGAVTRIVRGRRERDVPPSFAVEFGFMDPVTRLILAGALRKVPPPIPRRAQRIDYVATLSKITLT
jgi:hypothetical protein